MSPQRIQIAGRTGIPYLYHYQGFNPDHLVDTLQNHRVFCSNPATFNDPWDCKPCFDLAVIDNPETRRKIAEQLIANHAEGPKGDEADDRLRGRPDLLKALMLRFTDLFAHQFIPERLGVYCLAKSPDTTLMWSHYAKNHTGICLEFNVQGSNFAHAWAVHYQQEYPVFHLDLQVDHINILITKSDVWAYEEEFRLVCPRFTDIPDHPLLMDGDFLAIGDSTLRSVIIGCQADYDEISKLVKSYAPTLPLRRAIRAGNKYRLSIEG